MADQKVSRTLSGVQDVHFDLMDEVLNSEDLDLRARTDVVLRLCGSLFKSSQLDLQHRGFELRAPELGRRKLPGRILFGEALKEKAEPESK